MRTLVFLTLAACATTSTVPVAKQPLHPSEAPTSFRGLVAIAAEIATKKTGYEQVLLMRAWVEEDGTYTSWQGHAFVVADRAALDRFCSEHGAAAGEHVSYLTVQDGRAIDLGDRCEAVTLAPGSVLLVERDFAATTMPAKLETALVEIDGASYVKGLVSAPTHGELPGLKLSDLGDDESFVRQTKDGYSYTFSGRQQRGGGARGIVSLGARKKP